jgi:carbonic anhydrase
VLLTDNGRSVKVDLGPGGGSLIFTSEEGDVKIYEALQMHFHAPAEHTFDGSRKQYDLELHIVHRRYNVKDEQIRNISQADES